MPEQPVRTKLRPRRSGRRTLDQRLMLRLPRVGAALARAVGSLPPHSRLRRASLTRSVGLALESFNRRDLDAAMALCDPDFEYRPEAAWVRAGLVEESYRGMENYRRFVETVDEVWGGENYLTPLELVDDGERLLMLADGRMRAQASGVALSEEYALLATLKHGRPRVMQEYYDHAEALAQMGLAPESSRAAASGAAAQ
jgi:ketosteroid isomerase-like protein